MICPICKANDQKNKDDEFCQQCGSDVQLHYLLGRVRGELEMKNQITDGPKQVKKNSLFFPAFFKGVSSILLVIFVAFSIFVGWRFLSFLEYMESHRLAVSNNWSEIGFVQLREMNEIIKQELDLIIDQRKENKALQEKIYELSKEYPVSVGNTVKSEIPVNSKSDE